MGIRKKEKEPVNDLNTVCIFGISSFVGSNLARILSKEYKIVGTYKKTKIKIPGALTVPCDVLSKDEVQMVLYAFKPNFVIYCVGNSSLFESAHHVERTEAIHTNGLFNVSDMCLRYKARLIYLSSAYVFRGENRNYTEMDLPDSITALGKFQSAGEFYLQKNSLNYIILRICDLYGRGLNPVRKTFFENLELDILRGKQIVLDGSVKKGYLDVSFLGTLISVCIRKGVSNRLLQMSSSDTMSHYEFAKNYCEVFGQSVENLAKSKWPFPNFRQTEETESGNLQFSMDTSNLEGFLRLKLPTIRESLEFSFKKWHGQKKKSESASSNSDAIRFI